MATVVVPKLSNTSNVMRFKNYKYGGIIHDVRGSGVTKSFDFGDYDYQFDPKQIGTGGPYDKELRKNFNNKFKNVAKRAAASWANGALSLVRGLAKFGEAIYDTGTIVKGAVASVFTLEVDAANFLWSKISGEEWEGFKYTKALWEDVVLPEVGKDYVGTVTNRFYEDTAAGKWLEKNAYSAFKKDGIGCKIGEGVGYYAGVAALTAVTAGAAGVTSSVTTGMVQGVVAGTTAIGKNTQSGYNKLSDEDKHDSAALGKMMAVSTGKAVVEGGVMVAGAGLGAKFGSVAGNIATNKGASAVGSAVAKNVVKVVTTGGIKAGKAFANEGIDSLATGEKYDGKKALVEGAGILIAETVGGSIGAVKDIGKVASQEAAKAAAIEAVGGGAEAANSLSSSVSNDIPTNIKTMDPSEAASPLSVPAEAAEGTAAAAKTAGNTISEQMAKVPDKIITKTVKEVTKAGYNGVVDAINGANAA